VGNETKKPVGGHKFLARRCGLLRIWLPCDRKTSVCGLRTRGRADGVVVATIADGQREVIKKRWGDVVANKRCPLLGWNLSLLVIFAICHQTYHRQTTPSFGPLW
jgi:hypothetical protein